MKVNIYLRPDLHIWYGYENKDIIIWRTCTPTIDTINEGWKFWG